MLRTEWVQGKEALSIKSSGQRAERKASDVSLVLTLCAMPHALGGLASTPLAGVATNFPVSDTFILSMDCPASSNRSSSVPAI